MNKTFDDIYNETYDSMLKYVIYKCSDLSHAEDLMQNIYLNLYQTLTNKPEYIIKDAKAFVFIIAKREIAKHYDLITKFKNMFDQTDFSLLENKIADSQIIEVDFINKENRERVWMLIRKEDAITQKIMVLHYLSEMTIKDISSLLKLNENTTKTKIYRTIEKIKQMVGGE